MEIHEDLRELVNKYSGNCIEDYEVALFEDLKNLIAPKCQSCEKPINERETHAVAENDSTKLWHMECV